MWLIDHSKLCLTFRNSQPHMHTHSQARAHSACGSIRHPWRHHVQAMLQQSFCPSDLRPVFMPDDSRAHGFTWRAQFQSHMHILLAIAWLLCIWMERALWSCSHWRILFGRHASSSPLRLPLILYLALFWSSSLCSIAGLPALVVAVSVGFTRARGYGTDS